MDPFEATAVVFGIVAVFLQVRQKVWSWPASIVNVTMYAVIFFRAKLYAYMGLQVVYLALSVYGWYEWLYGGAGKSTLAVSRASPRLLAASAVLGAAFALLLGFGLGRFTDAAIPYTDSALTAASLVAQWMLTRKILENWAIWVAVNIVSIGVFQSRGMTLTAVLYGVFLALAVLGWVEWKRDLGRDAAIVRY